MPARSPSPGRHPTVSRDGARLIGPGHFVTAYHLAYYGPLPSCLQTGSSSLRPNVRITLVDPGDDPTSRHHTFKFDNPTIPGFRSITRKYEIPSIMEPGIRDYKLWWHGARGEWTVAMWAEVRGRRAERVKRPGYE